MTTAVTVLDVARHSGVSKSTVSLVLQDSPLVKDSTREKVQRSAEELGYVYNRAAASLRKTRSGTIGLVVTTVKNYFFAEAVSGVEGYFASGEPTGHKTVFLGQHFEDPERLHAIVRSMLESRVDGLIVVPTIHGVLDADFRSLVQGVPTVYLSRRPSFPGAYVGPDNYHAGYAAARHLVDHGHRQVVLLGGVKGSSAFDERVAGSSAAARDTMGQTVDFRYFEFSPSREGGYQAMIELISSGETIPGIVAYNDLVATGVMSAATENNLVAGRDFAVVGVDNIEESRFTHPPLTTVDTHPGEIGIAAATGLARLIGGAEAERESVVLPNELLIRNSCGCGGQ